MRDRCALCLAAMVIAAIGLCLLVERFGDWRLEINLASQSLIANLYSLVR
jgi:hypothetical protein